MHTQASTSSASTSSISSTGGNHESLSAKKIEIPKNPKIVTALYKYKTRDKNELAFKKGDKLIVLDDFAPGWWIACKLGSPEKSGCIPINFVTVDLQNKE